MITFFLFTMSQYIPAAQKKCNLFHILDKYFKRHDVQIKQTQLKTILVSVYSIIHMFSCLLSCKLVETLLPLRPSFQNMFMHFRYIIHTTFLFIGRLWVAESRLFFLLCYGDWMISYLKDFLLRCNTKYHISHRISSGIWMHPLKSFSGVTEFLFSTGQVYCANMGWK